MKNILNWVKNNKKSTVIISSFLTAIITIPSVLVPLSNAGLFNSTNNPNQNIENVQTFPDNLNPNQALDLNDIKNIKQVKNAFITYFRNSIATKKLQYFETKLNQGNRVNDSLDLISTYFMTTNEYKILSTINDKQDLNDGLKNIFDKYVYYFDSAYPKESNIDINYINNVYDNSILPYQNYVEICDEFVNSFDLNLIKHNMKNGFMNYANNNDKFQYILNISNTRTNSDVEYFIDTTAHNLYNENIADYKYVQNNIYEAKINSLDLVNKYNGTNQYDKFNKNEIYDTRLLNINDIPLEISWDDIPEWIKKIIIKYIIEPLLEYVTKLIIEYVVSENEQIFKNIFPTSFSNLIWSDYAHIIISLLSTYKNPLFNDNISKILDDLKTHKEWFKDLSDLIIGMKNNEIFPIINFLHESMETKFDQKINSIQRFVSLVYQTKIQFLMDDILTYFQYFIYEINKSNIPKDTKKYLLNDLNHWKSKLIEIRDVLSLALDLIYGLARPLVLIIFGTLLSLLTSSNTPILGLLLDAVISQVAYLILNPYAELATLIKYCAENGISFFQWAESHFTKCVEHHGWWMGLDFFNWFHSCIRFLAK